MYSYLLLHLCDGRRDIITGVYQKTFIDGLQIKEEGVKGVIKMNVIPASIPQVIAFPLLLDENGNQ